MKTLICNAHIFTVDAAFTQLYGCVGIEDARIVFVQETPPADFVADRVIDAAGKMLIPGLINAHTHLAMTFFRGYANDLNLQHWLADKIWPAEERLRVGDCTVGSEVGIAEMLRTGTTCFADMYMFMEETAQVVGRSGIRAVLGRGTTGFGSFAQGLREGRTLCENYQGAYHDRVRTMVAPHAEYTNTPETLQQLIAMARELQRGVHVHAAETVQEVQECRARHEGRSPIRYFADMGMFACPTLAAHCVAVDGEDIALLAKHGVSVAHNPSSNMKLGSGIAPVAQMLQAGVNVALGTDGVSSNNTLDMVAEMRQAALLAKVQGDPTAVNARQALEMATIAGARALGWEREIGSIEVGKQADLVLLNTAQTFWTPRRDLLSQLVYAGNGRDVYLTMVAGKVLMEAGEVKTLDVPAAMHKLEEISRYLYE